MGKFILMFVWVLELLIFIFGGGCVIIMLLVGGASRLRHPLLSVWFMLLVLALGFSVFKAWRPLDRDAPRSYVVMLLMIPVVIMFVFAGSCLVA